jgi:hypothetical protein
MATNTSSIIGLLKDVSRHARTGDYGNAASFFNRCILQLQEALGAVDLQEDLRPASSRITASLQTLLSLLEHGDWVAIADVVDYEFIPLLENIFPIRHSA